MISIKAFRLAADALSGGQLHFYPDRIYTTRHEGVVFEWNLMQSTLKLEYDPHGKTILTYRSISQPTKNQELNASNMGALGCHSAKRYMDKAGLTPWTATPEDFVNILLQLEQELGRSDQFQAREHKKND